MSYFSSGINRVAPSVIVTLWLFATFPALASITVSPPNWWVGMQQPQVELMLHGPDIANNTVRIDSKGVTLKSVNRLESDNYLFVTLDTQHAKVGNVLITLSDPDGNLQTITYSLKERTKNSQNRQGFSARDAIYLITPDRFANANINNDNLDGYQEGVARNLKGGRHGGDIEGIIEHLDYIADMGFSQIWTMPMLENDMPRYSYHGYSITDHYTIDPRYGSNTDYIRLSKEAAKRGIGLIMDMVLNHIGSHHEWMNDAPSKDWINNNGQYIGTTHRREALHDPHAVPSDIDGFSKGWFVPSMPDLNQENPHLATYLIQNAIWWVEYANLSGIRVDTYSYSDKAFLSQWSNRLMDEYPALNIVGEEWSINPVITSYWQAGSVKYDHYNSALPSVMDFPLQHAVSKALTEKEDWNSGLSVIYQMLASDFLYGDANNLVIFADNHDMSRIVTQCNGNVNCWNMAMTFFLTARGIPQVFYGTEILMGNPGTDDHGVIRSDFPGGWPGDTVNGFTGEGLSEQQQWAQSRVKQLLSLRKLYPLVFEGGFKHYAPKHGVYSYFRYALDNTSSPMIMVILNKNETDKEVDISAYHEMINDKKTLIRLSNNKHYAASDKIRLAPMSAAVFIVQ